MSKGPGWRFKEGDFDEEAGFERLNAMFDSLRADVDTAQEDATAAGADELENSSYTIGRDANGNISSITVNDESEIVEIATPTRDANGNAESVSIQTGAITAEVSLSRDANRRVSTVQEVGEE